MPNTAKAKKRMVTTAARSIINKSRLRRIATYFKKARLAIAAGGKPEAEAAARVAEKEIMKGVSHGALPHGRASRRVSRLVAQVKAMP